MVKYFFKTCLVVLGIFIFSIFQAFAKTPSMPRFPVRPASTQHFFDYAHFVNDSSGARINGFLSMFYEQAASPLMFLD